MRPVQPADSANQFAVVGVDRIHVVAAGDVNAMGGGVDQQVVPPTGVSQLPVIENFIWSLSLGAESGDE